jgi:homoserine O-acetyltransferase
MRTLQTLLIVWLVTPVQAAGGQEQRTARIGDLKLESGDVIRDCVIGYRTFGNLNPEKSNAVVFPTAFGWRSAGLASRVGPGKLVDNEKYFVIVVDSLGDGISSSPSNSKTQPGLTFPKFSIRDLVNAEHKLVIESLHLSHLHAVIGFSMGGMQAFQWSVSYPGLANRIVSIVGSPQLTSYDMLVWRTQQLALESDPDWKAGRYTRQPALHLQNMVAALLAQTPQFVATNTSPQKYQEFEADLVQGSDDLDANDTLRQIQALLTADIAAPFGGSLQGAAAAVTGKTLVIVNKQDRVVNPLPAIEFAKMIHAQLIELDSSCGHRAHTCEMKPIGAAIAAFLEN